MSRVMVVWEDRFHGALDRCLRRAVQHVTSGSSTTSLYFDDVRGNGNFKGYIERDFAKLVKFGTPKSGGPMDLVLCVADADHASDCCPIPLPPSSTTEWIERANAAFTGALQTAAGFEPRRVMGRFLRWSQESLLIAAHDVEQVLHKLGCRDRAALAAYLDRCDPRPGNLSAEQFIEHYRRPSNCLDEMLEAAGAKPLRKGSLPLDDALDTASRAALGQLLARIPDLAGLAESIAAMG